MIKVRHHRPGDDLSGLANQLARGELRSGVDNMVVAVRDDQVIGSLVGRHVHLVHGLWLTPELADHALGRRVAERMVDYGLGWLSGLGVTDVVMLSHPDNQRVRDLAHSRGGYDQQGELKVSYIEVI